MQTRRFDRFITELPFQFTTKGMVGQHESHLKNLGRGGLCFQSRGCLAIGTRLDICVPLVPHPFYTTGEVVWGHQADRGQCELGIEFQETLDVDAIKEVGQIEQYKQSHSATPGHRITSEDAAMETGAMSSIMFVRTCFKNQRTRLV